jgi:hypothetical protein
MNWIKVEDKLPEKGQVILTYNGVTGVNQSVFYTANGKPIFKLLCWNNKSGEWYPIVSHWMPIPNKPEGL